MAFEGLIQSLLSKKEVFRQQAIARIDQEVGKYSALLDPDILRGNLPPELRDRLIAESRDRLRDQLKEICPAPSELEKLLKVKQILEENILRLSKSLEPVQQTVQTTQSIISAISPILTILKGLPIPAKWVTVGTATKFSDILNDTKIFLEVLNIQIGNLNYTITTTQNVFLEVTSKLSLIDVVLTLCSTEQSTSIEQSSTPEFQNLIATLNEERNQNPLSEEYRGYLIEVKNDPDSPAIAPRRFAVAIAPTGAIVYKGPISFSSSTKILIDEVRFYIDQLTR